MKVKKKTLIDEIEIVAEYIDNHALANAKSALSVILYTLRNDVIECSDCETHMMLHLNYSKRIMELELENETLRKEIKK